MVISRYRKKKWNHTGDGSIIPSLEKITDGSGNSDENSTFHLREMRKQRAARYLLNIRCKNHAAKRKEKKNGFLSLLNEATREEKRREKKRKG